MPDTPDFYVALGDSMSLDFYPVLDLESSGRIDAASDRAAGAASLLHRNDDALWPEFTGRDLTGRFPSIRKLDLCADGATLGHTLDDQLPRVGEEIRAAARVVTVTAGGNDLLGGLFEGAGGFELATRRAIGRYGELVDRVVRTFPAATIILTTVYDPTDGSGILPGISDASHPLPMELLVAFNDVVRRAAAGIDRAVLADVHDHFIGHGLSAPVSERWYWAPSPIEPGARGASEIRRVWLDALAAAD